MKKLFFAICFTAFVLFNFKAQADVATIEEAADQANTPRELVPVTPDNLPDPNNIEEVRAFLKQRFQTAIVSRTSDLGDLNKANSIDIQHSTEYIQNMQEQKKSAFEKIYDQMIDRIDKPQADFSEDTVFYEQIAEPSHQPKETIDFAVVQVRLPNGQIVLAPAREHIPYLLTSYHILPTGSIEVEEDVVVIANGERLKNGLVKIMPKYSKSRNNIEKKIEIDILSVTLNGQEIPHKLQEFGNEILFVPKEKYILEPGVYTYHFNYVIDRKLWYYDDFTELYDNPVGSYPNFVIASANSIVSVPDGHDFISQLAVTGRSNNLNANRTVVARLNQNALGFASIMPIGIGEGMHILVSLDKNIFIKPGFGQRFAWFIGDYGDIIFLLLGFIAIFASYLLSWRFIKGSKSRLNVRFKQTAALNRYILKGVYDERSFVSAFLDLIRYNVVDLQQKDESFILIKKTDKINKLPISLRKIMKSLFEKTTSFLAINAENKIKFDRAVAKHSAHIKTHFKFLAWRLNMWYLLFSLSMLVLTLAAVSYIAINPLETMLILMSATLTFFFYVWMFKHAFAKKWLSLTIKMISSIFILLTVLLLSIYIHFISALLILCIVCVILEYSLRFSAKDGLIQNKVRELSNLNQYLKDNALSINVSKEFEIQQANIFAFGLENMYEKTAQNKAIYKLDLAEEILKIL